MLNKAFLSEDNGLIILAQADCSVIVVLNSANCINAMVLAVSFLIMMYPWKIFSSPFHSKCWCGFQWQYKVEVQSFWVFYCGVLMLLNPLHKSCLLWIVHHCVPLWMRRILFIANVVIQRGLCAPCEFFSHLTHSTDVHIPADVCVQIQRIPNGVRVFFMALSWWNQGKHHLNMMRDVLLEWKAQADNWKDIKIFLDVWSAGAEVHRLRWQKNHAVHCWRFDVSQWRWAGRQVQKLDALDCL